MTNYVKNGGIKINIKGKASAEEISKKITATLLKFQDDFGIEEFAGVNFYFNPIKDDEHLLLIASENNKLISGITYPSNGF